MRIDIFAHILPPKYLEAANRISLINPDYVYRTLTLSDLDARFRIMDKYDDYVQVLSIPGFHRIITEGKDKAVELAKLANDDMAELISRYPDRFVGGVASLPLNNMDAADSTITVEIMDLRSYIKNLTLEENRVKVIYADR